VSDFTVALHAAATTTCNHTATVLIIVVVAVVVVQITVKSPVKPHGCTGKRSCRSPVECGTAHSGSSRAARPGRPTP
jgi:hypothetical protein